MSFPLNDGEATLHHNIFPKTIQIACALAVCTTPHETRAKQLDRQLAAHERCRLLFCNKTQTHEQTEYIKF